MNQAHPAPFSVAIQGEAGAFSHEAGVNLFGPDLDLVPTRTFDDLFSAVVSGEADRGIVPVENTLAGSVPGNLQRVLESGLHVVGETRVRIRLLLLVEPGRQLSDVRRAASHPVALQQCFQFFREHPEIEPVPVYDTAGSVRDLMIGSAGYDAAIGSALAAEKYGAQALFHEIEDDHLNFTRFFAISREAERGPGKFSKTSLAFVVPHEPGSLHRALAVFSERGIDLTKLESSPIRGRPWEYRFFADLRADSAGVVEDSLAELADLGAECHVLGSYREWPPDA